MARPIVGGIRVKKENRVQKNGDIYVYERKVQYDPETRTNKTISRTLLGVKHPGSDEIQKTRRLLKNSVNASSTDSTGTRITTRKKIGLLSLLEWVGEASDIDSDIRVAFGVDSELASQCIAIARFWVAANGATLSNMRTWQIKHGVSSEELISESIYGTVFETIGQHENYSQNYFKCRCNGLSRETVIAIDTTTTSTYSSNLDSARFGYNKDGDKLPTIKTLTLYSLDANQPIAFYQQPGNIPDVISIRNALKELSYLHIEKPLLVADNGFYSRDNVSACLLEHMRFIIRVTIRDGVWIRKSIDAHLSELDLFNSQLHCEPNTRGITVTLHQEFNYTCKYNTSEHKAGDKVTFTRRLYLHVYRMHDRLYEESVQFEKELDSVRKHILEGDPLTPSAQNLADQCLEITSGRGGLKVKLNQKGCLEYSKYFGLLIVVSNTEKDREKALTIYRKREHIEDHYEKLKNIAEGSKPRVWDDWKFRGRQFVQFVCLGYFDFLYKKLKDLKQSLGLPNGDELHDLEVNIKEEKKVKSWIENKSLHEILDWFDCVEQVNLCGGKHPQVSMITEQVKRDIKFLDVMGYTGKLTG